MDRTAVVTGASAGIGAATARALARDGFRLALVGRHSQRLATLSAQCRVDGAPAADGWPADFARLDDVRALARDLLEALPRIDVLVNNAGLVTRHRELTPDGHETMFAVNHLAPYLLTRLLTGRLVESAPSRVIVVASDAYTFGELDPDDWMSTGRFAPMKVYGRSKLANMLFTVALADRLKGTGVTVNCLHPGFVSTSLARDSRVGSLFLRAARPFIRTPEKGAATTVFLATEPVGAAVTGAFFVDGRRKDPLPRATDREMAQRLWDDSADLVGLSRS